MTRDELRLIEYKIVEFICACKVIAMTCEKFDRGKKRSRKEAEALSIHKRLNLICPD